MASGSVHWRAGHRYGAEAELAQRGTAFRSTRDQVEHRMRLQRFRSWVLLGLEALMMILPLAVSGFVLGSIVYGTVMFSVRAFALAGVVMLLTFCCAARGLRASREQSLREYEQLTHGIQELEAVELAFRYGREAREARRVMEASPRLDATSGPIFNLADCARSLDQPSVVVPFRPRPSDKASGEYCVKAPAGE